MNTPVEQHPASVDAYIRHGWSLVPIPRGTKTPVHEKWNLKKNTLISQQQLPPGYGIGLAHAYSGTMALDIDDWNRARTELAKHEIDLDALYQAQDAVIIDSGKPGHGKLLYAMPMGVALPSKKLIDTRPDGSRYNYLDFRCATSAGLTVQDVLPPSIHPETQSPYRWAGNGHWSRLPTIPDKLLVLWHSLINQDQVKIENHEEQLNTTWEEILTMLEYIPADISREEWVAVGMVMHWAGHQTDQLDYALHHWDQWSALSSLKYPGWKGILTQWNSFRADKPNSVRLGTLKSIARRYGWAPPPPDISDMFSSTNIAEKPINVIDALRPPAPDIDLSLFPKILRERSQEISDQVGCDVLVPLFAGLAAVSGVVDAQMRLELVPGFKVPPVLWLMTLGNPADKKSPGSRPMIAPIRAIEADDRPRFQKDLLEWEGREAAYASAKKAFLEFSASTDAMLSGDMPPEVPELPPQPVPLKVTVSDITSQKLVRQCAERPRGLLCHLDEMNSWVRKMTDKTGGEDRSTWVVAYESQPYEMDRVGAGNIHCDNFAVSIYGNIQPSVFREALHQLGTDGLIQRFIPAILRPDQTRLGEPVPEFMGHNEQWEQTLRIAYALPAQTYRLSSEAYQRFREFQRWYEDAKQTERLVGSADLFMTAFGKLEGTAGRLMLLFHIIDNPFSSEVQPDVVDRVVNFIRGYVIPAFRYMLGEVGGMDTFDVWMGTHIIHHSDKEQVTLGEIKRSARRQLAGMTVWQQDQAVYSSMALLEKANWVARVDDGSDEHRHKALWYINPELKTLFKSYRDKVIRAKQDQLNEIYKESRKEKPKAYGTDSLN